MGSYLEVQTFSPRTRSSAREGGGRRPEVRAGTQVLPRVPLLIQINKPLDGNQSLALSLGIDPNPSPLTRSSFHLSFIFSLCFQIGRRRKGWAEGTDVGWCAETRSETAFSPSSLSIIRGGVNGGLGRN